MRPDYPEARRNRSYIWLTRGDFQRGWPEYEWRLKCEKLRILPVPSPRWQGEDLEGRSILLVSEQGLGDTFQFIRFAPLVKERAARVDRRLSRTARAAAGSLPGRRWRRRLDVDPAGVRRPCAALERAVDPGNDAGEHPRAALSDRRRRDDRPSGGRSSSEPLREP